MKIMHSLQLKPIGNVVKNISFMHIIPLQQPLQALRAIN